MTAPAINLFNRKITRLLRERKKTISDLADFLQYDALIVRQRLSSKDTFDFGDLVKICRFLSQLPCDFFHEAQADPSSALIKELRSNSPHFVLRIAETHKQLVKTFSGVLMNN